MEGLAASVVLIAVLLGVLLLLAFDLFCLVHLAAADRVRFLPKLAWAVAIVCISPFGGLVYFLSQRQPKAIAGFLLAVQRRSCQRCRRASWRPGWLRRTGLSGSCRTCGRGPASGRRPARRPRI